MQIEDSIKNLVVLSESLHLGGTSTFALNLCDGLRASSTWNGAAVGIRQMGEIGKQMQSLGLPVFQPASSSVLHEERIEDIYRYCSELSASAVVAGLGSSSFDFLRYVPAGCLRIGMIQSDDEPVYQMVKRYLPWLDIVCGVSTEICRKMENLMGDGQVSVVHQPYGVPMPEFLPARSLQGPLKILYLGRVIEDQKRIGLMSRVMRTTLESGINIHWTIAGDGPGLAGMKREFATDRDKVDFLGGVPYRDVPEILIENDVYFLCSDYEGLPLSLLECMGAGLVPVVSDLPSGISEVVNDGNGIRVSIDDEDGYVRALVHLANDTTLRNSMSAAAASEVSNSHSTAAMARRWVDMLETHLSDRVPHWKSSCKATAPMELDGQWKFSPAMRPVRKLLKRLRR